MNHEPLMEMRAEKKFYLDLYVKIICLHVAGCDGRRQKTSSSES